MTENYSVKEIEAEVSCGFCHANRGKPCRDTRTGKLARRPHPSRVRDAVYSRVGEPDYRGSFCGPEDWDIVHD